MRARASQIVRSRSTFSCAIDVLFVQRSTLCICILSLVLLVVVEQSLVTRRRVYIEQGSAAGRDEISSVKSRMKVV